MRSDFGGDLDFSNDSLLWVHFAIRAPYSKIMSIIIDKNQCAMAWKISKCSQLCIGLTHHGWLDYHRFKEEFSAVTMFLEPRVEDGPCLSILKAQCLFNSGIIKAVSSPAQNCWIRFRLSFYVCVSIFTLSMPFTVMSCCDIAINLTLQSHQQEMRRPAETGPRVAVCFSVKRIMEDLNVSDSFRQRILGTGLCSLTHNVNSKSKVQL